MLAQAFRFRDLEPRSSKLALFLKTNFLMRLESFRPASTERHDRKIPMDRKEEE